MMNKVIEEAINDGIITTKNDGNFIVYTFYTGKCKDPIKQKEIFNGFIKMETK